MNDEVKRLVEAYTDPEMTSESRASVLAYARGRLDTQKELKASIGKTLAEETSQKEGWTPSAKPN